MVSVQSSETKKSIVKESVECIINHKEHENVENVENRHKERLEKEINKEFTMVYQEHPIHKISLNSVDYRRNTLEQ